LRAVRRSLQCHERPQSRQETRITQTPAQEIPDPRTPLAGRIGIFAHRPAWSRSALQVISRRYERGSIVLTTNKPFKQWATIFNNDSTITSAVLDRLLHHAETVVIEGTSYRMKDQTQT